MNADEINLDDLVGFLVRAKRATYAGDGAEVAPQRPGFKDLEYIEGDWEYRDSYSGFYRAPGQEVVRFKGEPVWIMSYDGGMKPEFQDDEAFAKQTFAFLKKALMCVDGSRPYRGPHLMREGYWKYSNQVSGDITSFSGTEKILFKGKRVFTQNYIGGLIIHKK